MLRQVLLITVLLLASSVYAKRKSVPNPVALPPAEQDWQFIARCCIDHEIPRNSADTCNDDFCSRVSGKVATLNAQRQASANAVPHGPAGAEEAAKKNTDASVQGESQGMSKLMAYWIAFKAAVAAPLQQVENGVMKTLGMDTQASMIETQVHTSLKKLKHSSKKAQAQLESAAQSVLSQMSQKQKVRFVKEAKKRDFKGMTPVEVMMLEVMRKEEIKAKNPGAKSSNGMASYRAWPNGVIPVMYDPTCDESCQAAAENVFKDIADCSAIKFYAVKDNPDQAILVRSGFVTRSCASQIGAPGEFLGINIHDKVQLDLSSRDMANNATIAHELLHLAGFAHTQSRSNRNDWVTFNPPGCQKEWTKWNEQWYDGDPNGKQYDDKRSWCTSWPTPSASTLKEIYVADEIANNYDKTNPQHVRACIVGRGVSSEFWQYTQFDDLQDFPADDYDYGSIMHYYFLDDCMTAKKPVTVQPFSAYLRPFDCNAANAMYKGRKVTLDRFGVSSDIWVAGDLSLSEVKDYLMNNFLRMPGMSSDDVKCQIKKGSSDWETVNWLNFIGTLDSKGLGLDWQGAGTPLTIKLTKQKDCFHENGKVYIKADGDCKKNTGFWPITCNTDDQCSENPLCGGICICEHVRINECTCVQEKPDDVECS